MVNHTFRSDIGLRALALLCIVLVINTAVTIINMSERGARPPPRELGELVTLDATHLQGLGFMSGVHVRDLWRKARPRARVRPRHRAPGDNGSLREHVLARVAYHTARARRRDEGWLDDAVAENRPEAAALQADGAARLVWHTGHMAMARRGARARDAHWMRPLCGEEDTGLGYVLANPP